MTHHDDEDGHYTGMVGAIIAFAWFYWHLRIYWQPQKDATWKCCYFCDKNTRIENNVTKLCGWLSCYTWCGATIIAMTVLEICAGCLKSCNFIDDWSLEHVKQRQKTYLIASHTYEAPKSEKIERETSDDMETGGGGQSNPFYTHEGDDGGKSEQKSAKSGGDGGGKSKQKSAKSGGDGENPFIITTKDGKKFKVNITETLLRM